MARLIENLPIRICIVGGGFIGLYTALYLSRSRLVKSGKCLVTLIEPKDNFLFTPLLYEILTGELDKWEIAPSYQKLLLGKKINWIQDKVEEVNFKKRHLVLSKQYPINYDYLLLGAGRKTKYIDIPGFSTHSTTFCSIIDAEKLNNKLKLFENSNLPSKIAIIGAGPSGVELACKISDRLNNRGEILLIDHHKTILRGFNSGIKKVAIKAISRRNIQVLLSAELKSINQSNLILNIQEKQKTINIDLVIWTGGTESLSWVNNLDCQKNKSGQLLTLPSLQIVDYPEVFAVGDIAEIRIRKIYIVPNTAQAAYQQAKVIAKNLQAKILDKQPSRFYYVHLGDMLTLGKGKAVISCFGFNLIGSIAGWLRRLIYIQRLPTLRHRLRVLTKLIFKH